MIWARHGHRGRFCAGACAIRRLSVVIEYGTCRSVRTGAAARSLTDGKLRRLDRPGGFFGCGGNRRSLGDQESVSRDTYGAMMVEAGPSTALVTA